MSSRYAEVGVDVRKRGVEAFERVLDTIFPQAFCPVVRDPKLRGYGIVLHTDGAGSKPLQSYLHWCETGDPGWFKELAQDVVAMNLDDVICVGAEPQAFVDYVSLNPSRVPKRELLAVLGSGFRDCFDSLERHGIKIRFLGGETADLGDQLRTLDVSGTMSARLKLSAAVSGRIKPGDVIIGLRSGGRAKYEKRENSGLMCNGITLARHCLMRREYGKKYPELKDPEGKGYYGKFAFDDHLDELGMTAGEAILSPTRIFAHVVRRILRKSGELIKGLVHNTGGGQTKCLRLGKGIHYIKEDSIKPDPIFSLVKRESKSSWCEMFECFNMGIGFEIIAEPEDSEEILSSAERLGVQAKVVGRCERSKRGNRVTIRSGHGKFAYGG